MCNDCTWLPCGKSLTDLSGDRIAVLVVQVVAVHLKKLCDVRCPYDFGRDWPFLCSSSVLGAAVIETRMPALKERTFLVTPVLPSLFQGRGFPVTA